MVWSTDYGERVYDWWGRHPSVYRAMMKAVTLGNESELRGRAVESLRVSEGDTVLDLACGHGPNFPFLRDRVGEEGTVVGLDYSRGMLRKARIRVEENGWSNVSLVRADAADAVLREGCVDAALCTMSMSAIPDHTSAVENVYGSLVPGGRFCVLDSKEFEGAARLFNPVARPLFKYTTNWDYTKDVVGCLREVFCDGGEEREGEVEVERYNSGSIYLAVAGKQGVR